MSLANLKPGDTVVLVDRGNVSDGTIVSVGRKWITVAERRGRFSVDTGHSEGYAELRIRTREQHAEDLRTEKARQELSRLGIHTSSIFTHGIPLEKVIAVLEAVRPILGGGK